MAEQPERATSIGRVLEAVVTLSRGLAGPRSSPFGELILTRAQLGILFILARAGEPVSPGRLSATLRVTPSAITQAMDQLRTLTLVEQSCSDSDGRARVWTLTAAASAQVAAFEAATVTRTAPWFDALSADEITQLARLLSRIHVP